MLHVDEGALHAYLDGALDAYPAAEARSIREHLEHCGACAASLAAERRIRDDAQSILDRARISAEMPPFEELRALAANRTETVVAAPPSRLRRVSWAASIMLALGTGWMLRGGQVQVPDALAPETSAPMAVVVDEAEGAGAEERSGSTDPRSQVGDFAESSKPASAGTVVALADRAAPQVEESTVTDVETLRTAASIEPSVREGQSAALREAALRAVAQEAAPVDDSRGARVLDERMDIPNLVAARSPTALVNTREDRVVVPAAAPKLLSGSTAAPRRSADSGRRSELMSVARFRVDGAGGLGGDAARRSSDDRSAVEPNEDEPGPMSIPGLELLFVEQVDEGVARGGVRVVQRLENGDTLEMLYLPPGLDPDRVPGIAGDRRTWIAVERGEGWLVIRADLPIPELEALVGRLGSTPGAGSIS